MKIIEFKVGELEQNNLPLVLCLGSFDSLHLGHTYIVKQAIKSGYPVAVMTFDINPKFVLGIREKDHSILSLFDKASILEDLGVEYLYVLHFDETVAALSRYEFVESILKIINPKRIYCGEDYRFGFNAMGSIEYLRQFFDVEVIKLLKMNQKKISTADIISYIQKGEMENANELLNRYYSVTGTVVQGYGNGKKIGFPTANLDLDFKYVLPKEGVYIGYAIIDEVKYKAIISVGTHPTIMTLSKPIIEVHVLSFSDNLYGKFIDVQFVKRTRNIITFESLDELKNRLEKDKEIAKKELK